MNDKETNNPEQRSEAWFQARCGCVTASRVKDILAKDAFGYSPARRSYLGEIIAQRLTGKVRASYSNAAMRRGTELEPVARQLYIHNNPDAKIQETGFILHPSIKYFGASPDGLVNDDGLIEIKCPNSRTHLETIRNQKPRFDYIIQMHAQMMCTERHWCDFISYDDRLSPSLCYFKTRIIRDENLVKQIESEVIKFLDEVEKEIQFIENGYDANPDI